MKKIVVLFVSVLIGVAAFAQADTLYLSDIYTTHIRYTTEISYIDIASTETVLCKQVDQNKNVLAVRAAMPFSGLSSLTVIEANETIHTYIVTYCQSPKSLIIDAGKKGGYTPVSVAAESGKTPTQLTTMRSVEQAIASGGVIAAQPQKGGFSLSEAMNMDKTLYHLSDKQYDILASCDNVMIYRDQIYFVITLSNKSGKAYNCPDASFVIEPKARNIRYLSNDRPIYSRSSSGSLSCAPGKSSKVVYCFDVFTILKDQVLKIYINELDGQRELCITLDYKDVNKARVL